METGVTDALIRNGALFDFGLGGPYNRYLYCIGVGTNYSRLLGSINE